ncbi:hypothetical protein HK100_011814 [Physocladia obscura]|uniref:Methyltransferase domain-containing protein n=1 Tax=Physocladia obscura TaxID=109957 RepID=A0AAD5T2D3_9FUNG|nr:hypothetical protein HK100_011814 [Physocladia obscura]
MGPHQSKTVLPKEPPASAISNSSAVTKDRLKDSGNSEEPKSSTATASGSKLQINETKKQVKPAHINTVIAKTWNPNDPKSWEPEMREYHSLANSDYMLPNDATEQNRLEMQHYVLRAVFKSDIICPAVKELATSPGYKILDVGCAKGFWLKCVKKDYPLAECYGVDISESLVQQSTETSGISLKFGNVLETLPFDSNTFDFVHQRALVLGMPREKFPDAVRELIRVTKPGGWIELVEGDVVIYNAGPYSQTLTTALFDGLHRRGLDCYAASNLLYYAKQVAENVEYQEDKMARLSLGWGSKMGILCGSDARTAYLGMEDWMHKAMGLSREDYRDLVQNCYSEWPVQKSFAQVRALHFQVKK